jgi:small-conductance mechanosensitive channel
VDIIPDLVIDIKKAILDSCDKVISDATRKLSVYWTGYSATGLEVVVNCKLSVPPKTGAYNEARQEIMEAIARAVRRNGVEFSPPTEVKLVDGSGQGNNLVI